MNHKNYNEFEDDILSFFEETKKTGSDPYLIFFCSGDCYAFCDQLHNAIDHHYNFSQEVISDVAEHFPKCFRGGWEFNRNFRKWRKMKEPGLWQSITHTCSVGEIEYTERVSHILGLVTRIWYDSDITEEDFRRALQSLKQRIFTEWYFTKSEEEEASPISLIIPRHDGGAVRFDDEVFKDMIFSEFGELMDMNAVKIDVIRRY